MTCPHFDINIVKRSEGQSAVNAAAYQAGEKLYSEREKKYMYQGTKEELVMKEIFLPGHAPPEFSDRQTLWNSVENAEPNWNSQLARRMKIALPKELSLEENIALAREYCRKEFVSKGMIVDLAVHNPKPLNHNPHFHILLTMRPMDESGKWAPKARKEYIHDEQGNRILGKDGRWKFRKTPTMDWNAHGNAEMWRHDWEVLQNQYLERSGSAERVCLKSYERQGINQIPTVHMGPAVAAMERKGIRTDVGDLNREIIAVNAVIRKLKQTIRNLTTWITDVRRVIRELEMQPKEVYLYDLLCQKFRDRKKERFLKWNNRYAADKAGNKDFQRFVSIIDYMKREEIFTVKDLEERFLGIKRDENSFRDKIHHTRRRIKEIEKIREAANRQKELDPVHDAYMKIWFPGGKAHYEKKHKDELDEWKRCNRYLRARFSNGDPDIAELSTEYSVLQTEQESAEQHLSNIAKELNMLKDIKWLIKELLPELNPNREEMTQEQREKKREALTPDKSKKSVLSRLEEKKSEVEVNEGRCCPHGWRRERRQQNMEMD